MRGDEDPDGPTTAIAKGMAGAGGMGRIQVCHLPFFRRVYGRNRRLFEVNFIFLPQYIPIRYYFYTFVVSILKINSYE